MVESNTQPTQISKKARLQKKAAMFDVTMQRRFWIGVLLLVVALLGVRGDSTPIRFECQEHDASYCGAHGFVLRRTHNCYHTLTRIHWLTSQSQTIQFPLNACIARVDWTAFASVVMAFVACTALCHRRLCQRTAHMCLASPPRFFSSKSLRQVSSLFESERALCFTKNKNQTLFFIFV